VVLARVAHATTAVKLAASRRNLAVRVSTIALSANMRMQHAQHQSHEPHCQLK
jgi:hypothetical protein